MQDEVMVPVKTASLVVQRWVRDSLAANRPTLRISCRSAAWPPDVLAVLQNVYGDESCAVAMLQPLSDSDVNSIALSYGIDADSFEDAIQRAGAQILSQQPLTLEMLLRVYKQGGALPTSRSELFARGVEELSTERIERLEGGTAIEFTVQELLEAAERLACFSLLSGRESIDLGDSPSSSSLGRIELGGLPAGGRQLDDSLIRAVGRCGLCDSDGPRQFRFAHRQFAEYLAGRRLAKLLFHQSRALLSAGLGWHAGVAGPLRETAAFTAMHSDAVAAWVAENDPEVIGLSDVADDALRRRATLNLLAKFRQHELTDAQIIRGEGIELAGYRYAGAETDLGPVLQERNEGCEDVLECAVALIDNWRLTSMSDDLADLVLDRTAPLEARRSAGYALARMGEPAARRRLRPLVVDHHDDRELDLKGLALRCNWPDGLTVIELLDSIATRSDSRYGGAYRGFLFDLERSGFKAAGHTLEGLTWAKQFLDRDSDIEPQGRIARQITIASVDEIDSSGIAAALADLIIATARNHTDSPLTPPPRLAGEDEEESVDPRLRDKPLARRKLVDALAARAVDDSTIWWAARQTPDLVLLDDFPWLLERATTTSFPMSRREMYAQLARTLPWHDSVENVDAWLAVRTVEPVASCFPISTCLELDSEEAAKARKIYAEAKRWDRPQRRQKLSPAPTERVAHVLMLSETKDANFFLNLAEELTLEEYSTHYRRSRFLTKTPGWADADAETRQRIVEAAKRLLMAESDEPERSRSEPLNSILSGHMAAMWLVMQCEPAWLEALPTEWWKRWCWYILRELHAGLSDEHEQQELKLGLLQLLHNRAPVAVRATVEELAALSAPESRRVLSSLLDLFSPIEDATLDTRLCEQLESGQISEDLAGSVAQFLLLRNNGAALSTCLSCLEPEAVSRAEGVAVSAAVALLQIQAAASWPVLQEFLERRPDLAVRVLGEFAYGENFRTRSESASGLAGLDCIEIGQFVSLLFNAFPPNSDPRHDGACNAGPEDSARRLRDQLVSWLSDQADIKAVAALRLLEHRFGNEYSWLRRPRARAERAYRQSCFGPIPPHSVAELLAAESARLIRSGQDAVEGVVAAIEQYAQRLRHDSPNDIEDLWNRPRKGQPTPKEEERVSDKLCTTIRNYFRDYAVTADREVQIFRRKLSHEAGGAPGSEVDVLCRIPAAGVANTSDPIAVPVEVKLSHNPEARTGLRDQLVNRYMAELGTSYGVFVVAWMGRPSSRSSSYRPVWKSLSQAREYLANQAAHFSAGTDIFCIRTVVIDASLPSVKKSEGNPKKAATRKRPPTRKKAAAANGTGAKSKAGKKRRTKKAAKGKQKRYGDTQ